MPSTTRPRATSLPWWPPAKPSAFTVGGLTYDWDLARDSNYGGGVGGRRHGDGGGPGYGRGGVVVAGIAVSAISTGKAAGHAALSRYLASSATRHNIRGTSILRSVKNRVANNDNGKQ